MNEFYIDDVVDEVTTVAYSKRGIQEKCTD